MKATTITILLTLGSIVALFGQSAPIEQAVEKLDSEKNSPADNHASRVPGDLNWGKRDTEWSSPADNHASRIPGDMTWDKSDTE
ncbi:hypothetical protein F5H01DRAFT_348974 [Linnemannia elongata]|nr:hypothetical protein F5H01DRAFT_348974 [Linnemannia elongata]